ncbi:hypothetical protein GCM10027275_11660 [Rhabdobacter roseus]|uniref:Uncharacterized protein n=1 Tax=Rhabdobacter roseus TaxID=1655419 RepID=A0A840TSV4_9BACT|nr:hypothetical protein [Rhabdobacter roseus]MBB5283078.1 hypothetical protein [Rhabdobacter roseus]
MTKLHGDWLTEGIWDFEYKKYVLLAYLQQVEQDFSSDRLFPYLPDLRLHYENSLRLKEKKGAMRASFPKRVRGIDKSTLKIQYEEVLPEDTYLSELNAIIDYALPRFSRTLTQGQERYGAVEASLTFVPVGIMPLRTDEGYLFIHRSRRQETSIFRYQVALFGADRQRYVQTVLVDSVRKGLGTTFENLKVDLVRRFRALPNPATYMVETQRDYPLDETLLPAAKQLMIRHLNLA